MINQTRLQAVLAHMAALDLPQIIVSGDASLYYLMNKEIHAMERVAVLLIKADGSVHGFMNQLLCVGEVEHMISHTHCDTDNVYGMIAAELTPGKVGIDDNWFAKHAIALSMQRDDIQLCHGSMPVDLARNIKDEAEKELLRNAGRVNDQAIALAVTAIKEGVKEEEVAALAMAHFKANSTMGTDGVPCTSFGPNSAIPHHMPDDTKLVSGQAVLMDYFAKVNGYWCDMTRTFFYQSVSEKQRQVYEIVKKAQQVGIDAVRPGILLSELDTIVRNVIVEAGYGPQYIHRTGHGIGLMVHEYPDVSSASHVVAEEGMVFSIEPGIYLEGEFGVRIEDLVIVTKDGCEVLTVYPKELQVIG